MGDSAANKGMLSIAEQEAEILKLSGCNVVSEDEFELIGSNYVLPWRERAVPKKNIAKKEVSQGQKAPVVFKTKFEVVELDADGFVVDKGDEDFEPSPTWQGRKPGFEFKLGERGLGYYRTGKKVVVPSQTAY
jgi:hypothetical protein